MANLFRICLLLCVTGVLSDQFKLEPQNVTVLQGSDARFNATVKGIWGLMTWHVQGNLVLHFSATENNKSSGQYSAKRCFSESINCVEFTIHNTTRRQSGLVSCFVQGNFGSRTSNLQVQVSGEVNIMEGNVTVEKDQQVELQCVTTGWYPEPTVSWTQDDQTVNSSLYNTTDVDYKVLYNTTSVLKFQAVSNTKVECLATVSELREEISSSVYVVVVPKPPDWTVLIAVVCSIGGFALLVLLIIGIIFCCKRRKEKQPNYQDEMSRRVRTQSQLNGVNPDGQTQGQVNAGYVKDNQVRRTSVAPSEFSDSSIYQTNGPNILEMPDTVNSNKAGNSYNTAYNTPDESGPRKHRHVTIV